MEPQQQLRVVDTVQLSPSPAPAAGQAVEFALSGLDTDRNVLDVTFRTLRFFPPHPPSLDPLAVLPGAFAAALGLFPQLAGTLGADGRVVCSAADNILLVLAASDLAVAEVDTDSPGSVLLDRLAPGDDGDGGEGSPVLALQATRFACGSVALGMRVAHALCDGAGATKFLSVAARFARGLHEPAEASAWERHELLGPRRPPRVARPFDRVLALDAAAARYGPYGAAARDGQGETARGCFHVSDARVEALRAQLTDEAGIKLTTFEVLAAFICRARVKANGTSSDEVVKMVYSMNISKLVDPPLPDAYWGNVCVPVYVALTAGEISGQPLAETAALIKQSKREVDDEYVRSYIDLHALRRRRGEGVTAGRGVCAFTDWRRLGHSEVDFGWGSPDVVLPLSWRLLGSTEPCFFLPYGGADERRRRGFKVFVAMLVEAMPCFREEMEGLALQHQFSSTGKL